MNSPSRSKNIAWPGLVIVALTFIVLAALTWRKWPDALIDFGMQLYAPWRISQGEVLYRDVHYLPGGPLSQNFNAQLFKLFGVSLLTLIVSNLVILAALITLVYRRFLAASDTWTATLVSLSILIVFAFGQYSDIDNYNFITPYCHEIVHGLALSIVAIVLLSNWLKTGKSKWAAGAGFCTGLVFMTKPDTFIALSAGTLTAFVLAMLAGKSKNLLVKSILLFLFTAAIPLLAFLLYFHQYEGWRDSLGSVCFAFAPLLKSGVFQNSYYRWVMGLNAPGPHLRTMLTHCVVLSVFVVVSVLIFRRNLNTPVNRMLGVAWIGVIMALASGFNWVECGPALPFLDATLCALLFLQFFRSKDSALNFPLLWSVFALALLSKLGLFPRIWHYGFALAMPAFVSAVFLLFWLLPLRLKNWGVNATWLRIAVALFLLTGLTRLFLVSHYLYRERTIALGTGGDRIFVPGDATSPSSLPVQSALAWLEKNAPTNATLSVLPEGVMINYLSRHINPTRYPIWVPPELAAFGQSNMTADFETHPPDFILLAHRDISEYGIRNFGQDERFGAGLMRWVQTNYTSMVLIGKEPFMGSSFGIKILKRNEQAK